MFATTRNAFSIIPLHSGGKKGYSCVMKKLTAVAALVFGLAASGMAAEFKGFVEDTKCSTNPDMKGDADCAKKCIKGGSPAVLVTDDGKIYKISNQDKIVDHAGMKVVVTGDMKGDTITVASVKMQ
jgi:Protein of unknown function (DUF5818)